LCHCRLPKARSTSPFACVSVIASITRWSQFRSKVGCDKCSYLSCRALLTIIFLIVTNSILVSFNFHYD
jgi:hypothetical protein